MPKDMLIQHQLKRLRLPTMGHQYQKLAQEAARDNRPYEDFLLSLLEAEVAQREENTRKRLTAQARFPYIRTLDQFDFSIIQAGQAGPAHRGRDRLRAVYARRLPGCSFRLFPSGI